MNNWGPALRRRIADADDTGSLATKLRARRFRLLQERFPDFDQMRILDLGGCAAQWRSNPVRPASVVMLNIIDDHSDVDWITPVNGDACAPPKVITDGTYDLVYSNSVIEHVGGHERRCRFAELVHRGADRHWVQTPNRYFPIEPHWVCPGLQFLPLKARAMVIANWPLSPARPRPTLEKAYGDALWIELIGRSHMRHHFPHSEILEERLLGTVKSLVAVNSGE